MKDTSSPAPRDTQPISTNEQDDMEEFSGQGLDLDNLVENK